VFRLADWSLPADSRSPHALLTVDAARAIDRAAIAAGTPEIELMERAGSATADAILSRWERTEALILAGPGNNGGDGFVIARRLAEANWPVRVALAGARERLSGAAALAASRWPGPVQALKPGALDGAGLVVDALFGTGLARELDGAVRETVEALNGLNLPVVAVDIPSGIDADSGQILGAAVQADLTVTFFRRKPGHLLLPGREAAGETIVSDLAVAQSVYASIPAKLFANAPDLWLDSFPWPSATSHKYTRGHVLVLGGSVLTGAARLAAHAAQRIGAGLVTIAADPAVIPIYAVYRPDLLMAPITTSEDFRKLLADPRRNAVLLGPGAGTDRRLESAIGAALATHAGVVLDADSFPVLADRKNGLLRRLGDRVLLTPHEGEFARLFGDAKPRLAAALRAAAETRATVLLKGSDTIVAAPDGCAIINSGAPPELATAGTGDVLAGLAAGLIANHLSPLQAAAIACCVHGRAAALFGPGLLAGDLPDLVPRILASLRAESA